MGMLISLATLAVLWLTGALRPIFMLARSRDEAVARQAAEREAAEPASPPPAPDR